MEIALRDPTYSLAAAPTVRERLATQFINDRRDARFLGLMAFLSATVIPTGLALFVPHWFRWWAAGLHLALVFFFLGPFVLMLHNTSHRRLFRRPWGLFNQYIPWVLGPFFGESPEAYFTHHVGMHHPENNLEDDLSSTLPYRRDSFVDFMRYFLYFLFTGIFTLSGYFVRTRRRTLLVRTLVGELFLYALIVALFFVNWRATLVVFFLPLLITRFAMMAGNWGQHAFVDQASPENSYRNSITCINSTYNQRCFNDGYHIGHHLKATRHWTELPDEFRANVPTYARERAIVFWGIDFFGVWVCLMLKRYDWLAARFVQLDENPLPNEEIIRMMRERTGWTRAATAR